MDIRLKTHYVSLMAAVSVKLLGIIFFLLFLSPDFHNLWCSHIDSLSSTEVAAWPQSLCVFCRSYVVVGYISTGLGDCFTAPLMSLMVLPYYQLSPVPIIATGK